MSRANALSEPVVWWLRLQIEMLKPMAALIAEHGPFRMIIIDSVIALFRVEFVGRG
jgi:RecA/RadA recombinase